MGSLCGLPRGAKREKDLDIDLKRKIVPPDGELKMEISQKKNGWARARKNYLA